MDLSLETTFNAFSLNQLGSRCAHRPLDRKHTIGLDDFMSKIFNE